MTPSTSFAALVSLSLCAWGCSSTSSSEPGDMDASVCAADSLTGLSTFKASNVTLGEVPATITTDLVLGECGTTARITSASPSTTVPAIDTDTLALGCTIDPSSYQLVHTKQSDGTEVAVLYVRNLTISKGATIVTAGLDPLVIVASSTITIAGTLLADAGGTRSTPGPAAPGGVACGGSGGPTTQPHGTQTITPLHGGAFGLVSGESDSWPGDGGGALQLVAGTLVEVSGAINAGGAGTYGIHAGGGSGGAILIEAPRVSISGVVAANGGGGNGFLGTSGQDGAASTVPAAGAGGAGDGSAGTGIDGEAGTMGGPGGGAGWIRINAACGTADLAAAAVLSPASTTRCVSFGMLSR